MTEEQMENAANQAMEQLVKEEAFRMIYERVCVLKLCNSKVFELIEKEIPKETVSEVKQAVYNELFQLMVKDTFKLLELDKPVSEVLGKDY